MQQRNSVRREEYEAQRRQRAQQKQIDCCVFEMVYAAIMVLIVAIFLASDNKENCGMNIVETNPLTYQMQIKTWLIAVVGYYLCDFMLLLAQYHHIKQTRKESMCILMLRFMINCFLFSWLIYGNTVYFRSNLCESQAYYLWLIMFLVLLVGYFEMLKCCCVGTCVCIMLPIFFFAVRRA